MDKLAVSPSVVVLGTATGRMVNSCEAVVA